MAPVVSMFHNRKLNNLLNHVHERALIIKNQDHNSTFEEFNAKEGSFKIHDRNLQRLLNEIFKVKMKLAPEIMNEVFEIIESPYPLRIESRFKSQNICTVRYGIEATAFVGSRIWSYIPSELEKSASLNEFSMKIKTWKPEKCPNYVKSTFRELVTYKLLISICP